jgi:hypothetical protein
MPFVNGRGASQEYTLRYAIHEWDKVTKHSSLAYPFSCGSFAGLLSRRENLVNTNTKTCC